MRRMYSEEQLERVVKNTKKDITTLVDSAGRDRFIEGEGTPSSVEGVTITYSKYSLSATHLMLVVAGTIAENTSLVAGNSLSLFSVPSWIMDKVLPIQSRLIEYKTAQAVSSSYDIQNLPVYLNKEDNGLDIKVTSNTTINANRSFRIQFDLLIDSD